MSTDANTTLNPARAGLVWLALALALGAGAAQAAQPDCSALPTLIDRLQVMAGAESTARDALATMRRNAQDWKNLLLRGRDEKDRQTMQSRFDTQASTYSQRLVELRAQLAQLSLPLERLEVLQREEVELFGKYRAALARHGVASLEAAAAADREVQGADVLTFRTLEQTIDWLAAGNREQFSQVRQGAVACQANASTPASAPLSSPQSK
jgi:hypothetical protein